MSWKCKPAQRGESDISASGFSLTIEGLSQFDTVAGAFGWGRPPLEDWPTLYSFGRRTGLDCASLRRLRRC